MKQTYLILFITALISISGLQSSASINATTEINDTTYIYLKDYGLLKTRKKDCINIINKALKNLDGDNPKVLIFNRGIYHFYPNNSLKREYYESNTSDINPRNCAFVFEGIKNLIIDGKGSTLIFHEQMQPFTFDNCENLIIKNINIDWEQPLIAQAEVMEVSNEHIDIAIDLKQSPYQIQDGKIFFNVGRKKQNPWTRTMEYVRDSFYIVPQTGDRGCLGPGWNNYLAENLIPGVIRLHYPFERKPQKGNFLIMRHSERIHSGIFIQESKNISVQNLNIFHATGLGILAQYSQDLTFNGYRAVPNRFKKRYFGGGDDGLQISNCKGQVNIFNCEFAGLQDDPVNVHGTSVQVIEKVSEKQLKCKFKHHQSTGMIWGRPGDKISFIENEQMNSLGTNTVSSFKVLNTEEFVVSFKTAIPDSLEIGDALENLTWTPDVHIKDSHFKNCRARGVLLTTPGKVVIENNTFESSGSAILISGDANGWFESGAVTDVLIQNNIFTDLCNTSSYQFCEGIISVFPILPKQNKNIPKFHKNIRIKNNEFHPFDFPVLFARSVDGITFSNNTVKRSYRFKPYHRRQYTFSFDGCTNIDIRGNSFSKDVLGKNIYLKNSNASELKNDTDFEIDEFK